MTDPNEQQPERAVPVDPELQRQRDATALELWRDRQSLAVERERRTQEIELAARERELNALSADKAADLAYAARLARSDLVPKGFRAGVDSGQELNERQLRTAAASIVLAWEIGEALGYNRAAALQNLYVVDGRVKLWSEAARGKLRSAGWDLDDETEYNKHDFPVAHTVTFTAPNESPKRVTYRLGEALRGGMVSEIIRDGDGEVTGVKARARSGKVLPWELHTRWMLTWAATRAGVKLYANHLVSGLDVAVDGMDAEAVPAPVRATAERVTSEQPAEPAYDPAADMALIEERTGGRAWWEHAGAQRRQGVRRRNPVQMAADRVAEWVNAHEDEAHDRGLWRGQTETYEEIKADDDDPEPTMADYAEQIISEAERTGNVDVRDDIPGDLGVGAAVTDEHFANVGKTQPVLINPPPGVERPQADSEPVDAAEWYPTDITDAEIVVDPAKADQLINGPWEPTDAEKEAEYVRITTEELEAERREQIAPLLATIDVLAGGSTKRMAYMSEWINAHHKAPEDATVDELTDFISGAK